MWFESSNSNKIHCFEADKVDTPRSFFTKICRYPALIIICALSVSSLYQPAESKTQSTPLIGKRMPAQQLCMRIREDIDLKKYYVGYSDCSNFLKKGLNGQKFSAPILTESIYSSELEIVVALWQYGGRAKGGNAELISLLMERMYASIFEILAPLNEKTEISAKSSLEQVENLILLIFKTTDDKPQLARVLSEDEFFIFDAINKYCSQAIQHVFNGERFFESVRNHFNLQIPYQPKNIEELTVIPVLTDDGILNRSCVQAAGELFPSRGE